MKITSQLLYDVCEATWPPAATNRVGPWCIRDGAQGGQRVSATTAEGAFTADDLPAAEAEMRALGQPLLFQIREGEEALDQLLDGAGYAIKDPVNLLAAPVTALRGDIPRVTAFSVWPPLAIQRDIWAEGGITAPRVELMRRAPHPKTSLFGRRDEMPSSSAYVGMDQGVAMLHALEVRPHQRRKNVAVFAMRKAAEWAAENGAHTLAVLVTQTNTSANALYTSLGMTHVGQYHYRIKLEA